LWWALVLVGLCALLIMRIAWRRGRTSSINSLLSSLVSELKNTSPRATTPGELERTTRLARRILTPYLNCEAAGLSSEEMRTLADSLREQSDADSRSLAEIVVAVAELEDQAYAPARDSAWSSKTETSVRALVELVENHVRRHRPR
jgi:hypothetical protein